MLRFEFRLDPLSRVVPWGKEDSRSVHWFALTQGSYWVKVNDKEVLRLSIPATQRGSEVTSHEVGIPVHYFVTRLFEDLLDVIPSCMQEIPLDIGQRIWNAGLVKLYRDWIGTAERIGRDELSGESPVSHSIEWANSVRVDTRYLTSSLSMWFYRCGTRLCLEWAPDEDCPPGEWENPTGKEQVDSSEFEVACHDFGARLLREMGARIAQVEPGVTWPGVSSSTEQLSGEQDARSRWMDDAFLRVRKAAPDWDWEKVENALRLAGG